MKKALCAISLSVLLGSVALPVAFAGQQSVVQVSARAISPVVTTETQDQTSQKPGITMEEAQKIAEKAFEIPKGYQRVMSDFMDSPGRKAWNFNWSKNEGNQYSNYNVSVDADTGEIRNYNYNDSSTLDAKNDFSAIISRDQAHQIALKTIKRFFPKQVSLLKEIEAPQYNQSIPGQRTLKRYSFRFVRMVKGIAFEEDSIWISVMENGKLGDFNFSWNKLPETLPEAKIKLDEANKIFKNNLGLKLTYIKDYSKLPQGPGQSQPEIKLVYQIPEYLNNFIDAETGELNDYSGTTVTEELIALFKAQPSVKSGGRFELGKAKITKEDAEKIIASKVEIPEGYEVNSSEYRKDYNSDRQIWVLHYMKKVPDQDTYPLQVGVAADSGEIVEINRYKQYPQILGKDQKILSLEEGSKIAQAFLEKLAPEKAQFVLLDPQLGMMNQSVNINGVEQPMRWYHFTRYVDGIPVQGDGFNVTIDSVTGEISDYRQEFTMGNVFPVPKNIVPVEKILSKYLTKPSLQLTYFRIYPSNSLYKSSVSVSDNTYLKIGYRLGTEVPRSFDVATGKPYYPGYAKPVEKTKLPQDISKHNYKKAIERVVELNIMGGRKEGAFQPDEIITKAEFIKTIVTAKGLLPIYDDSKLPYKDVSLKAWYAPYVRTALKQNIITSSEKLNPLSPLSRKEAAVMAVKVMGYEKAAKLDIFKTPNFKGISKKDLGFAAMAEGFKVFPEKTKSYNDFIKRGEAAQIVINIFKN